MVLSCAAFNCTNRACKGSGISFYRFPLKNKELLSKWLVAVRRKNWRPSSTSVLCSKHFTDTCFRKYISQVRLREDAVPSIFDFPTHLQKTIAKPRRELRIQTSSDSSINSRLESDSVVTEDVSVKQALQLHNYAMLQASPRAIKRKLEDQLEIARKINLVTAKKLKVAKKCLFRHKKRLNSMKCVIRELKTRRDINTDAVDVIERCFGSIPAAMLRRKLFSSTKDSYSDTLRSFALTLHFYSPQAYDFVRRSFSAVLPHPSTLRRWTSAIDGKPGFTEEAFECLRRHYSSASDQLLCSLMFDEMSIRKHVQWNGTQNVGFIDLGTEINDDSLPVATEVLVFLVVPLNLSWKMPVAYFLIDGLSSDVKASLVTEIINRLYAVNVRVVAVVCDGPATNFAVGSKLGASFSPTDMKPYFVHPARQDWTVYMVFDACHMLKLMRNTLADKGILCDEDGQQIRWQHIKDLLELQDKEGLKAANKLKRSHIEWYQQKMKVSLAAQCLSRSVANALEFVSCDLKMAKFAHVAATVKFIRTIDRLFDVLNSKNRFAKEFKSVLTSRNEHLWRQFLTDTRCYLLGLKLGNIPLSQSPRKTTVLGFLATITSVIALFDEFVKSGKLSYLATYRLSQDHLELTFNVIRGRGRWNNNPTATQFRAAYRRLLLKHDISAKKTGNVVAQDDCNIRPAEVIVDKRMSVVSTDEILQRTGLALHPVGETDHDYVLTADKLILSDFSLNIVSYMAGYVARQLCKKLRCVGCSKCLISDQKVVVNSKLLSRKDAGGLIFPSSSLVTVCSITERCIRYLRGYLCGNTSKVPYHRNLQLALQIAVLARTHNLQLFSDSQDEHDCTVDVLENRVLNLIRLIVNSYVNIRFYAMGKIFTEELRGKNVRVNSNKQVLFAHQ